MKDRRRRNRSWAPWWYLTTTVAAAMFIGCTSEPVVDRAIPALDDRDFRGLSLGQHIDSTEGLELGEVDGDLADYSRPLDRLEIGELELWPVTYWFYRDSLHSVMAGGRGAERCAALETTLRSEYGEPSRKRSTETELVWSGRRASAQYTYDASIERCRLSYISLEVLEQMAAGEHDEP